MKRTGFELLDAYTYSNGDPPATPASSGVRQSVRSLLRASGLLPAMRRARDGVLALTDSPVTAQALVDESHEGAPADSNGYLASEDARSPRRTDCRGDNLVVIARRTH